MNNEIVNSFFAPKTFLLIRKPRTSVDWALLVGAASYSIAGLIFLALFLPTSYKEVKLGLLLCALASVMFLGFKKEWVWSPSTLVACWLLAAFGLANSVHGYWNGAPGAVRVLTVAALWPVVYGVLSAALSRAGSVKVMTGILGVSLLAVLAYSYLYLGHVAKIIPAWLYVELDQGQAWGGTQNLILEYNLYSISSLLFLFPFWLHYCLRKAQIGKANFFHWAALVAVIALCVLTGRRAVQIVAAISPLLILAVESAVGAGWRAGVNVIFNRRSLLFLLTSVLAVGVVLAYAGYKPPTLLQTLLQGFDFYPPTAETPTAETLTTTGLQDVSAQIRYHQFVSLLDGWRESGVWFGAGNGSHTSLIRDPDMPWAYELTYVYLLYSTGIVGVVFYFGWFAWGLARIRKALIDRPDMSLYITPIIAGVLGLCIGAATNPYFGKFDYLWVIMLPHLLAGGVHFQPRGAVG
ncbi:MAG: hypothetical protein AB1482_02425 [Pseudomonadota bacterium]